MTLATPFDQQLFDTKFLERLPRYVWLLKKKNGEAIASASLHKQGGQGEFLGHHAYTPGDDIRHLDWQILARNGQLFTKDFVMEGRFRLLLVIDGSASMGIGTPIKLTTALRLAASIAYVGLQNGCAVRLLLSQGPLSHASDLFHKPGSFWALLRFLSWRTPAGQLAWVAFPKWVSGLPQETQIIILTDLLHAQAADTALCQVAAWRHRLSLVHLWAKEEWAPTLSGAAHLRDVETNAQCDVLLNAETTAAYRQRTRQVVQHWADWCARHKITYFPVLPNPTSGLESPVEHRILRALFGE